MSSLLEIIVTIALFAAAVAIAHIVERHSCNPQPPSPRAAWRTRRSDLHGSE